MKKRIVLCFSMLLAAVLLLTCAGCGKTGGKMKTLSKNTKDLTEGITARELSATAEIMDEDTGIVTDFALNVFRECYDGGNTLISPISILCALGMAANGAQGETLLQMEQLFGIDAQALGAYMNSYMANLAQTEKYKLCIANSIWIKDDDDLTVQPEFLQRNAETYAAGVYGSAFDGNTVSDINSWVSDKTEGMIDSMLSEIPEEAIMYLINALSFDAEWENIYRDTSVKDGKFKAESGEERGIELMYSTERAYLESDNAEGFIKYYAGRKFAFAALLPEEGMSIEEYIAFLTSANINEMLRNPRDIKVNTAIPKFKIEYDTELSEILKDMGMTSAFDGDIADFGALGSYTDANIYISKVLHKTFIEVDERGTKAGAVTSVEIAKTMALTEPEEEKTVILDRPFVYMLIDCEENLPLFIGTVTDIAE